MGRIKYLILASAALAVSLGIGICLGSNRIHALTLLRTLVAGENTPELRILLYVRLPRVMGAGLAGMALAASGAVLQSVLGNPLASPNIIGVNAGAGFFVLLASSLLPSRPSILPAAAFAGAMAASVIVQLVSAAGRFSRLAILLGGFAVSSVFTAAMNTVLLVDPDAYVGSGNYLAGGLSGLTMSSLLHPAIYILCGLTAAVLMSGRMNILALGSDAARTLGMRVTWCRLGLLVVSALLAGAAVSFAGMVGFVGLVAPHTARFLAGQDNRMAVPLSALMGAAFVILCDTLARVLFAPYELPVGILMSFAGSPFFLYLVCRNRWGSHD